MITTDRSYCSKSEMKDKEMRKKTLMNDKYTYMYSFSSINLDGTN